MLVIIMTGSFSCGFGDPAKSRKSAPDANVLPDAQDLRNLKKIRSNSIPVPLTRFSTENSDLSDWAGSMMQQLSMQTTSEGFRFRKYLSYLDEGRIFLGMLSYTGPGKKWKIKIGQGGQIYSFKIPSQKNPDNFDELIAKQRADAGQWVDEVWQHTLPGDVQKTTDETSKKSPVVDSDIHQAGFYMKSDLDFDNKMTDGSVYSPLFNLIDEPSLNRVSYITWPQHAHLPRFDKDTVLPSGETYVLDKYIKNRLIMKQTITSLEDGVIQIDLEWSKWNGGDHEMVTIPKLTFRTSALPAKILSTSDNQYEFTDKNEDTIAIDGPRIGTWFALAREKDPKSEAVAVVFGSKAKSEQASFRHITYLENQDKSEDLQGTSLFVWRRLTFTAGDTMIARYFVIVGTVETIPQRAKQLASNAIFKIERRSPESSQTTLVCLDQGGALTNSCDPTNAKMVFRAFKDHAADLYPLFLMRSKSTGKYKITHNPYTLIPDPSLRRTPGPNSEYEITRLLGWGVTPNVFPQKWRCQAVSVGQALADIGSIEGINPETAELLVVNFKRIPNCAYPL
jgi:hypothetical protein